MRERASELLRRCAWRRRFRRCCCPAGTCASAGPAPTGSRPAPARCAARQSRSGTASTCDMPRHDHLTAGDCRDAGPACEEPPRPGGAGVTVIDRSGAKNQSNRGAAARPRTEGRHGLSQVGDCRTAGDYMTRIRGGERIGQCSYTIECDQSLVPLLRVTEDPQRRAGTPWLHSGCPGSGCGLAASTGGTRSDMMRS